MQVLFLGEFKKTGSKQVALRAIAIDMSKN